MLKNSLAFVLFFGVIGISLGTALFSQKSNPPVVPQNGIFDSSLLITDTPTPLPAPTDSIPVNTPVPTDNSPTFPPLPTVTPISATRAGEDD